MLTSHYRVGLAGFLHESNTFLPTPTTLQHFHQASYTEGAAVLDRWRESRHELGGMIASLDVVPLLATYAVPSGTITAEAFESIAMRLMELVEEAEPLDGLLIALHGATVSARYPDADGEILRRLRARLRIPIIGTLDLHANVSPQMAENSDALIFYRSNPHLDQFERGMEAGRLMLRTLKGEVSPVQWLETPPLLIPIASQNTAQPPARLLYDDVREAERWPGMLSASAAMGFYYADVAENGASFLAVADGDRALAARTAKWMAKRAWDRRAEFAIDLPGPAEAVRLAAEVPDGPVVLLDVGDNVGGGSAANSTVLLEEILRQRVPNALVVLYDPRAVEECVAAGVRNPVRQGIVRMIHDGRFIETEIRHGGWGICDQGLTAVVETPEQHTIVYTSLRMAPMSLEQILSLGIKPERKKIIVVKGVIAPRAAYEPVAERIIAVDTPGATAASPARFEYVHRRRPLYPLEPDAVY
ncbi:MAG TPA: M81 family metallopeptidase [Bryobacteraceae bacterium]|nr:M81 family metallopeptidase [Bryobacteraceae bacterium]